MEEIDLMKYKTAWKSEQGFEKKSLSAADIQSFLKKESKGLNKSFRSTLKVDIAMKTVLGTAFISLLFLYSNSLSIIALNTLMITGTILALVFQVKMFKRIPVSDYSKDNLRSVLESKISFYHTIYFRSVYIGALSGPLFFFNGMMYYFFFKYSGVRPLDIQDYIIFAVFIIAGFVLGVIAQLKQFNFQIQQLELSLTEIDENTLSELTIKNQNRRKTQRFLIALLAVFCGVLLLAYFAFKLSGMI